MWFKRRKITDQDHSLSESLKSLQSLLSETDRREPNLDPRDSPADEPDVADRVAPDPRDAPALKPRSSSRPAQTGDDARAGEPQASDAASNRWRDLSLSFDAEPVIPKTRRDRGAAAEHPDTTPEPVSESAEPAGETTRHPEPDTDVDAPAAAAGGRADDTAADQTPERRAVDDQEAEDGPDDPAAPAPPAAVQTGGPAADGTESGDPRTDPGHELRSPADEEVLVLNLDAPHAPGTVESDTAVTEPSDSGAADPTGDIETREPDFGDEAGSSAHGDVPLDGAPPGDAPAGGPRVMESDALEESHAPATPVPGIDTSVPDETDERIPGEAMEEDQLRLELEATGDAEADIPVLTNAVYVPGAPPEPPRPVDSPHEARIGRCMDNLRARLRLMELDALSAEQEQALHDTLAELLEELDRE